MSAPVLTLILILAAAFALWLLSLRTKDASIADIFWGPGFALAAWITAAVALGGSERAWVVLALVTLWALRLSLHIFSRHRGEDRRYIAMRKAYGPIWWWRSLLQVFVLQSVLLWIVSWPVQAAVASSRPFGPLDAVGGAIALAGLVFEAVADWQLTRFRADPLNADQVMDRGLWSWSRHPNYFGDTAMWWGFFLLGFAATHAWWLIVSPLVMTVLLLRVSGVTMLEKTIGRRRPAYADYIARTSAFVPLPPTPPATRPR